MLIRIMHLNTTGRPGSLAADTPGTLAAQDFAWWPHSKSTVSAWNRFRCIVRFDTTLRSGAFFLSSPSPPGPMEPPPPHVSVADPAHGFNPLSFRHWECRWIQRRLISLPNTLGEPLFRRCSKLTSHLLQDLSTHVQSILQGHYRDL